MSNEENRSFYIKIQSVFIEKTNNTLLQLFRYTLVGSFAFLVDFGTLFILTKYYNVYYLISAGISFTLGLIINYTLCVIWVFTKRSLENRLSEFLIFTFIGLIGLALNELFLWILTDIFLIYYLISKLITAFIVYLWNFSVRKLILFK